MIAVLMKVNNVAQHKFNYALDCFRKVYIKNSLSNLNEPSTLSAARIDGDFSR